MASERQEYNEETPWWGEHVHRYHSVLSYVSDSDTILDIACGNGFGSYILSRGVKGEVTGADISSEVIEDCKKRFKNVNLRYLQMDGTAIPFPNGSVNTVVSFETIEHTTDYRKMIAEFSRILKTNGTAIISTPNIIVNSPEGYVYNPYHTQEFTFDELEAILGETFGNVTIFGQKYSRYDKAGQLKRFGAFIEKTLYRRGFRKLPLSLQNLIMRGFTGKNMYPSADDFEMVADKIEILKCKTFFAVCKKK